MDRILHLLYLVHSYSYQQIRSRRRETRLTARDIGVIPRGDRVHIADYLSPGNDTSYNRLRDVFHIFEETYPQTSNHRGYLLAIEASFARN
jgi:hypothetical protein